MTLEVIGRGLLMLVSSFVGTLGFAMLLHAPRRAWLPASAIGGVTYTVYWVLARLGAAEPGAVFVSVVLGSVLAQYCARRMRMIATVFVLLSIVALVPGMGLYRCMHYLALEQYAAGVDEGVRAMVCIVMIAVGLGVGGFLFRIIARCIHPSGKEAAHK